MDSSLISSTGMTPEEFEEWVSKIHFIRAEAVRIQGAVVKIWKQISPREVFLSIWPRVVIGLDNETEKVSLKAFKGNKKAELEEISRAVLRIIRRTSKHDIRFNHRIWDDSRITLSDCVHDIWERTHRSMRRASRRKDLTQKVQKDCGSLRRKSAKSRLSTLLSEIHKDINKHDLLEVWHEVKNKLVIKRVMES